MELRTARLLLRSYQASDLAELHTILSDPAMGRWMDWRPSSPEDTAVFLGYALEEESANPRQRWKFAVRPGEHRLGPRAGEGRDDPRRPPA